ncbi:hypothetical protein MBLNU230_g1096t1 [Neophaeotheca triangularis]
MACSWGTCSLPEDPIEYSIFQYRPSLGGNAALIALFGISFAIHTYQALRSRLWTFGTLMMLGCACEMIGYGGRILMWQDPWSFEAFIMQIVCITIAPVFVTAAIYITLYKSILKLSPSSARFKPSLYFQIFIPCDIISLVLQAVGGAMSSNSDGSSQAGVNIGLAGLAFQVAVLVAFIALCADFAFRYHRNINNDRILTNPLGRRFVFFLLFLSFATLTIFIRCTFRIYELSGGYTGPALHNEGEFVGLESCMIVLATFALNIGHPGLVFEKGNGRAAVPKERDRYQMPMGEI